MIYRLFVCLVIILLAGCKKDEELISGDIAGNVVLTDQDHNPLPPQEDIKVDLYMNSEKVNSTVTDTDGNYVFENLPYGRYEMVCTLEGFIRSWHPLPVFHVGGYGQTIANYSLYQIPLYQIHIDSVTFYEQDHMLYIHLKVNGDTLLPGNSYLYNFRAFFSNSPGVTFNNYSAIANGYLATWSPDNSGGSVPVFGRVYTYDILEFEEINSLPIHMVIYPVPVNQGYDPRHFLPESLGQPSNEVIFDWNVISGN